MTQNGFFEPRRLSPTGLAIVVAIHAAALGALALMKGPELVRPFFPKTEVTFVPLPTEPPEVAPPPTDELSQPVQRPTFIDVPRPHVPVPIDRPAVTTGTSDPVIVLDPPRREIVPPRIDPPPAPVRTLAEFDPRFAGDLQPPYPASEERAGREGSVRVRLTIGADGRVKAVQRLSASSEPFWRATERHALARWRFRPATLDGRPIESRKVMSVNFEIRG